MKVQVSVENLLEGRLKGKWHNLGKTLMFVGCAYVYVVCVYICVWNGLCDTCQLYEVIPGFTLKNHS